MEPRVVSVHPFVGSRGATFVATVRGNGLREARSVMVENAPLSLAIEATETEPPPETPSRNRTPLDLVRLRAQIAADAKPGRYLFRLMTAHGLSNALSFYVSEHPVTPEPTGSHETADTAIAISEVPAVFTGRISRRGETDYYSFQAGAGETLTFEAVSGLPSLGAPGGNAAGFDPSLSIFEPSGSWFDPKRLNRIAFNDEPLWVIGRLTDAHLVHRFARAGRYLLRIEAFSGQGGPDYSYQLRILRGDAPRPPAPPSVSWDERSFTRPLAATRLTELAARGGKPQNQDPIETQPASGAPVIKLPGILEGTDGRPGETGRARFRLDASADVAIEVETPAAAPPLFNPVVRLLDATGQEVVTNVLTGRGACSGALTKSLQAKTIVPLRDPGDYTLEVRDATSDLAGPDFCYRVLVRRQIPHVGNVRIDEDHINLAPGEAKTVRIVFDREEDFRGGIVVSAESLPPGVAALSGADYEPDKDPPPTFGKRERYTPRTERAVVMFTASADAPPTEKPRIVRLLVRPVVDGKPGALLAAKEIPVMVLAEP